MRDKYKNPSMIFSLPINFIWTESELRNLDFWANLTLFGVAALFAYPVLQVVMAIAYKGAWRILVLLPLLIAGPAMLYTIVQICRQDDLWFAAAVYVMPPATLFLVAVAPIHWIASRQTRRSDA
jgi:hypothetical protein